MKIISFILISITLSGAMTACNPNKEKSSTFEELQLEHDFEIAKRVVSNELKDPESAQFRNLRINGVDLCGEVNAKNSFGGYTGFKRFWVFMIEPYPVTFLSDTSTLCE